MGEFKIMYVGMSRCEIKVLDLQKWGMPEEWELAGIYNRVTLTKKLQKSYITWQVS